RVHQVAEHHGELAAFSVGRRWDGGCDLDLSTRGVLGRRLGSMGRRRWGQVYPTRPDEDAALFIHRHFFGIDQVIFQRFEGVGIELELARSTYAGRPVASGSASSEARKVSRWLAITV